MSDFALDILEELCDKLSAQLEDRPLIEDELKLLELVRGQLEDILVVLELKHHSIELRYKLVCRLLLAARLERKS